LLTIKHTKRIIDVISILGIISLELIILYFLKLRMIFAIPVFIITLILYKKLINYYKKISCYRNLDIVIEKKTASLKFIFMDNHDISGYIKLLMNSKIDNNKMLSIHSKITSLLESINNSTHEDKKILRQKVIDTVVNEYKSDIIGAIKMENGKKSSIIFKENIK